MYSLLFASKKEFPARPPPAGRQGEKAYAKPLLIVLFNFQIRHHSDEIPIGCLCNRNYISIQFKFHCSVIRISPACAAPFYIKLIINPIQKPFFTFPERLLIVVFYAFHLLPKRGKTRGCPASVYPVNKKRRSIPTNVRLLLPLYVLSKAKKQQRDINKKKNEKELDDRTNLYS